MINGYFFSYTLVYFIPFYNVPLMHSCCAHYLDEESCMEQTDLWRIPSTWKDFLEYYCFSDYFLWGCKWDWLEKVVEKELKFHFNYKLLKGWR